MIKLSGFFNAAMLLWSFWGLGKAELDTATVGLARGRSNLLSAHIFIAYIISTRRNTSFEKKYYQYVFA